MPAAAYEPLERLAERLALDAQAPSKRMLVIVNPYATTMSDRLRNLVLYALQSRYEVEAIDTKEQGHATELCREAAHEGYDVVVAFGGDGTVNEAANGLAGSPTPLTCLPGGATNVLCRMLGIPHEIVDATEHLLHIADDWRPRAIDLGDVNGRRFTFSAGVGLDASVVRRVDERPRLKRRLGAYYFTYAALGTFTSRYLIRPPRLDVRVAGEHIGGVTAIVQNGDPFTYFKNRPIEIAQGARLDGGTLSLAVLQRASPIDMPTVVWRAFSRRAQMTKHSRIASYEGLTELAVTSADGRRIPIQVDGDWIGEVEEARFSIVPGGLRVVA